MFRTQTELRIFLILERPKRVINTKIDNENNKTINFTFLSQFLIAKFSTKYCI